MSASSYRLINFRPNPASGTQFTLGAIVVCDGGVRVARAPRIPGAECLGSEKMGIAVSRLVERFTLIDAHDELPPVFGPTTSLSKPFPIPPGVQSPVTWVERLIDGRREDHDRPVNSRGATKRTLGYRLLSAFGVGQYVKPTFRPESDWDGWLQEYRFGLPEISHWVEGEREILLMEPIVPGRKQFKSDLKTVATGFLAYRGAIDAVANGRTARLVAYVTTGGTRDQRRMALDALHAAAHTVIDTNEGYQRDRFIEQIREVATHSPHVMDL